MIRLDEIKINRKRRSIEHKGHTLVLGPMKFPIVVHLILGSGFTSEHLFDLIYTGADGGPEGQDLVIKSHIWHLLPTLKRLELSLMSERRAGRTYYWIESKKPWHVETYAQRAIKYKTKSSGRPRKLPQLKGELLC